MHRVNYLRGISCEHTVANWNESYKKDHQNGKMKLMKAYLYTNQLKLTSKDDITNNLNKFLHLVDLRS